MIVSLSELETAVERAARGSGHAYGIARAAGETARFLAVRGYPVLALALPALERPADKELGWSEAGNRLARQGGLASAMLAAPLVAQWLLAQGEGASAEAGDVDCPAWFVAALGQASAGGAVFDLRVGTNAIACARGEVAPAGMLMEAPAGPAAVAAIHRGRIAPASAPLVRGVGVDPASWARLEELAARVFVPATETSRTRGAGPAVAADD